MPWVGRLRWALVGALVLGSFLIGRLSYGKSGSPEATERAMYRAAVLTSPFLEPRGAENADPFLTRARAEVVDYIEGRRAADPTLRVSLYARDLDHGPWIGIGDRVLYVPSSLTKVVVLIRTLQREEEEPGILDREVVFDGPEGMDGDDTMQGAPDSLKLRPGERYTVRDLLRRMIVYSDNHAFNLVVEAGGGDGVSKMLYDLSAEQYVDDGRVYFDARTVATLLRSLYNSSLLSRRHSEYALGLLTQSRFSEGLRRFLPPDALVASKFGYYESGSDHHAHRELHECGVVYRSRSPYVLCVMTASERDGPEELGRILADISRILWAQ